MHYLWEAAMTLARRQFLYLAAGAAAISTLAQSATRAQAQAPLKGILAKRSARDRLEEALARIADPKGEGGTRLPYRLFGGRSQRR